MSAADISCPKCGALPQRGCRTTTGYPARTHAARFKLAGESTHSFADRLRAGDAFEAQRLRDIEARYADSPYSRGYRDGQAGKPGPAFPKGDATWAQRLYARGWSDAAPPGLPLSGTRNGDDG